MLNKVNYKKINVKIYAGIFFRQIFVILFTFADSYA